MSNTGNFWQDFANASGMQGGASQANAAQQYASQHPTQQGQGGLDWLMQLMAQQQRNQGVGGAAWQNNADTGAWAGGGVSVGGPMAAWQQLAQTNPAFAQMLQSMGIQPTVNGYAVNPDGTVQNNGGWSSGGRGGGYVAQTLAQQNRPPPTQPSAWTPAAPGAGAWGAPAAGPQQPSGAFTAARGPAPGGLGGAAQNALTGRLNMAPMPLRGVGPLGVKAAPGLGGQGGAGAPAFGGAPGGGLTGSMQAAAQQPLSVASMNPFDPTSVTRAQESNRNAAIQTMQNYQAGIGGSALGRGVEGLGAQIAANPEAIDANTYATMQAGLVDAQRAQAQQGQNQLREQLAAQGQLGTGQANAQLAAQQMGQSNNFIQGLRDLAVQRQLQNHQARLASGQTASGMLTQLGNLYGGSASKMADIFNSSQVNGQGFNDIMKSLGIGMGGGTGVQSAF